jgi:hypothetical protein
MRRIFSALSCVVKERSELRPERITSPSRRMAGVERLWKNLQAAEAMVVLPDEGKPVSQRTAPDFAGKHMGVEAGIGDIARLSKAESVVIK